MNAPYDEQVFPVREYTSGRTDFLFADETEQLERALLARLRRLESGCTLVVDFDGINMASDAARQFLLQSLRQVQGGELVDRGIVLTNLGRGLYNIEAMLLSERVTAVERTSDSDARLLGEVDPAAVETYALLVKQRTTTASEVRRTLNLNTIAAATNRLTKLSKLGAARRVGQEPVEGGGLQYRYAAIA